MCFNMIYLNHVCCYEWQHEEIFLLASKLFYFLSECGLHYVAVSVIDFFFCYNISISYSSLVQLLNYALLFCAATYIAFIALCEKQKECGCLAYISYIMAHIMYVLYACLCALCAGNSMHALPVTNMPGVCAVCKYFLCNYFGVMCYKVFIRNMI